MFPVVLFILAAVIQSLLRTSDVNHVSANFFKIENESQVTSNIAICNKPVLYAPDNNFTHCIMGNVTSNSGVFFGK
jgi:hypothetical protein